MAHASALGDSLVSFPLESTEADRPQLTRIVCTIGPSTKSPEMLERMMAAGMSVARMNFSHGDHKYHQSVVDNVRSVVARTKRQCAILLDTKGPEIRSGKLLPDEHGNKNKWLKEGQRFRFINDESRHGDGTFVATTYPRLPQTVRKDDHITVDDGLLSFLVTDVGKDYVDTIVENAGELGETKGVNLPGVVVDLPAVTEKDKKDIEFGVANGVDFIAASFVRKAEDVREIAALPGVREAGIKIISKIESQEGLDNFDDILVESDGIMVARGDLGVEVPIEQVASAQKLMINACNRAGKPVITATQMLDSMINDPRPTRAEVSDVGNAVFDGTDCVMLSGETAKGAYPIETIATMSRICLEAEASIDYAMLYRRLRKNVRPPIPVAESVSSSSVKTAMDMKAKIIVTLTDSGATAQKISKFRPPCPIVAVTANAQTQRQLLCSRGVWSLLTDSMKGTNQNIDRAIAFAVERGFASVGDAVVIVSGHLEGVSGSTNMMVVRRVPPGLAVRERADSHHTQSLAVSATQSNNE